MLLRKLHTLPRWNGLINHHISINLHAIASFILSHPTSRSVGDVVKVSTEATGYARALFSAVGYLERRKRAAWSNARSAGCHWRG